MDVPAAIDSHHFRRVMGQFVTGVTVVTTAVGPRLHGITVNSFSSVSLAPMLVAVCLDRGSRTLPLIAESGFFAVNILSHAQQEWANRFAGRGEPVPDDFDGLDHHTVVSGSPVLLHTLGWLDCRVSSRFDAGDHTIVLGETLACEMGDSGDPLLFYRGHYGRVHH
ncbi:MAG: flavin reductase family protein [Chloroflexota bacterium]